MESRVLRSIFRGELGGYIAMRAIKGHDVKALYTTSITEAEQFAEQHRQTHDVYFGLCTRSERKPEADYAVKAFAVWADLDAENPDALVKRRALKKAMLALVLPPSLIVDSGHNGFHLYWLVPPTTNLDGIGNANTAVETVIGSDAVGDVARILRVDGTYNHKGDPPAPVRVLRADGAVYEISDIVAACRLDSKLVGKIVDGSIRGFKTRSERDWHVITRLVKAGLTDAAIRAIFKEHRVGEKARDKNGDKYLEHTLAKAREETGVSEDAAVAAADSVFGNIYEKDDCYWLMTQNGASQLSTFTFEPEILLQGKDATEQDVLMGTVHAAGYEWPNIPVPRKAFVRGDTLIKELPLAAWQWIGGDREVKCLLPYLMQRLRDKGLPKRTATLQLGFHKGLWIGSTQTLGPEGILANGDAKVVALPTKTERPSVTYSTKAATQPLLREFFKLVQQVNRPEVIWPVLGWWAACPYKTRLAETGVRFPTLNLFGTRGSGKTSLITQIVQPLSGYDAGRTYDCDTTQFVMLSLLGSSNGVPVAFSEYRRTSLRTPDRILRYLLLLYDTGHDPRGRPDQTVTDYVLDAPVTIDGEDALSDPASLERIVQVNMHPEDIAEGSRAFETFQDIATLDLRTIGTAYVIHTLAPDAQPSWPVALELCRAAFPMQLPDRVRRNLAVVVVGLMSLQAFAVAHGVRVPAITAEFLRDVLQESLSNIVNAATGRTPILVDEFVEDVVNEAATDNNPQFAFWYDKDDNALWFHLSTALGWWTVKRRSQNKPSLDTAAIKAQLRERNCKQVEGPTVGQYIVGREVKTVEGRSRWCYGVSIKAAEETGLDIPAQLERFRPKVVKKDAAAQSR